MIDILAQKWAKIEKEKNRFINYATEHFADRLDVKPPSGGWNVLQITEHLIWSEQGTMGYIAKKTSQGFDALEDLGQEAEEATKGLVDFMQSDAKRKLPDSFPDAVGNKSFEAYKQEWEGTRHQMKPFLDSFPEKYLAKGIFRHPLSEMLNAPQTFDFFSSHIEHHILQLERLKEELG